jgi:hypothetical protein
VHLDDALVGLRGMGDLQDAMPHAEALEARARPPARDADRLRLLVRRGLEDDRGVGGEDARAAFADEVARGAVCRAPGLVRQADRDVDADRVDVAPSGHELRDATGEVRDDVAVVFQQDGEPLAPAGVDADGAHRRIV